MATTSLDFFPNPVTPDLGCFVRRKHGLETHPFNIFTEFAPSIDLRINRHQVYFRVVCGKAAFFQRAPVVQTFDASVPGPVLETQPPDFQLGGDFRPRPSDWQSYPTQFGQRFYWFFGQHRNPSAGQWTPDAIVGHAYDIYDNGTLSTVQFDDTGGDEDVNDFILEVAVVDRTIRDVLAPVEGQEAVNVRFEREMLPHLRERFVEKYE